MMKAEQEAPLLMTDEIAFKLGEFKFEHHYSTVRWNINREQFPLYKFFIWDFNINYHPIDNFESEKTDWYGFELSGEINFSKFQTISQKHAFIKGVISRGLSVKITENSLTIGRANDTDTIDFIKDSLVEILHDACYHKKMDMTYFDWDLQTISTVNSIPQTKSIVLTANKNIIDYITI